MGVGLGVSGENQSCGGGRGSSAISPLPLPLSWGDSLGGREGTSREAILGGRLSLSFPLATKPRSLLKD